LKKVFFDKVLKGLESLQAPNGILKAPARSPIGKHQNSLPLFIKPHIAMWQVYTVSYIVMWPHLLVVNALTHLWIQLGFFDGHPIQISCGHVMSDH
jgi:hypothetical protein